MIHVSSGALQPVFYALIALLGKVADGEETIVVLGSHIVCSSVLDSEARCPCWYRHASLFRALGCVLGKGTMQG